MKIKKNSLVMLPLGGCDRIGMNCMLYHYNGTWIMVDCGIMFPEHNSMLGIDVCVPDLQILQDHNIKLDALIVTHVHEDHIGGICYLIDKLRCPIYLTKFAANLLRSKSLIKKVLENINIIEILDDNPVFQVKDFEIEMVDLTHSTLENKGLYITAGDKSIFHTGDWRFDSKPSIRSATNKKRLKAIGASKLSALVCDSTNVFNAKAEHSEADLESSLYNIVSSKENLVVIAMLASNIERIATIGEVAKRSGRTLAISGSALINFVDVAQKSGYLKDLKYINVKESQHIKRNKLLVATSGCQGEEFASLTRMSLNSHHSIKLNENDCVVFSSKLLPQNFERIHNVINRLIRMQVEVITSSDALVHVTGHPSRTELKEMYSMLKPKMAIPVHGSAAHLQKHCIFAQEECNVKHVHFINNGEVLEICEEEIKVLHNIDIGYLGVDGTSLRYPDSTVLTERKKMGFGGLVACLVVLNSKGKMVAEPEIVSFGITEDSTYESNFWLDIIKYVEDFIDNQSVGLLQKFNTSSHLENLNKEITSHISKKVFKVFKLKPLINISFTVI